MNHVMIDVKTLGSSPIAALLSVSAVFFDPEGDPAAALGTTAADPHVFYRVLDIATQPGRALDPNVVSWWMHQPEDARDEVFPLVESRAVNLNDALADLLRFLATNVGNHAKLWDLRVWTEGAAMAAVLDDVYRHVGGTPWRAYNMRDTLTIYEAAGDNERAPHAPHAHTSWHDAVSQVRRLQRAHAVLNAGKRAEVEAVARQAMSQQVAT